MGMDEILASGRLGLVDEAVRRAVARLLDENEALRSQIATMHARLDDLERLADQDTLTPLPNRRCFIREVGRVVKQVSRYGDSAAVMFVDVDALKAINDAHGHSAGDAALIHVAGFLQREVRATDLVARIGGDEFGLLLDHLDEAAADAKARALLAGIAGAPLVIEGKAIQIGLSLGVAMVKAGDSVDALIARADAQMYVAKSAQRSAR